MLRRIRYMLIKEFIQVFRDKRSRFLLFGPPLIQMLVFGYAATLEIHHASTAVLDLDNTQESRELIAHFTASPYFDVRARLANRREIGELIDRGEIVLALQIRAGFAEKLRKGQTAPLQVIVDSANSNTALVALGYVNQVAARFAGDYQADRLHRLMPQAMAVMPSVELEGRPWFNPDLESRWFFVPGVIGNLILIMVVTLTAFAVVREREIGTLEQIMVTPIRRWEFILGKTIPFFLVGCFDAALIALVGTFWFGVPFRGNLGVLAAGLVTFILAGIGLGLFLSTVSANQQQAMIASFFFTMPMITLSGFGTPIASMPPLLQKISYVNPLRHVMVLLRSVYLKGSGFDVLWPEITTLAGIATLLLTISVLRFHKSLE